MTTNVNEVELYVKNKKKRDKNLVKMKFRYICEKEENYNICISFKLKRVIIKKKIIMIILYLILKKKFVLFKYMKDTFVLINLINMFESEGNNFFE